MATEIRIFSLPAPGLGLQPNSSRWQWSISHDGDEFTSGDPIASGPADFAKPDEAAPFALANLNRYLTSPRAYERKRA